MLGWYMYENKIKGIELKIPLIVTLVSFKAVLYRSWKSGPSSYLKHKEKIVKTSMRLIPNEIKLVNASDFNYLGNEIGRSMPKQKKVAQTVFPVLDSSSQVGRLLAPSCWSP